MYIYVPPNKIGLGVHSENNAYLCQINQLKFLFMAKVHFNLKDSK
jgi:hypothetical protein